MKTLEQMMKDLNEAEVLAEVRRLDAQQVPATEILQGLQEGMRLVGEQFEAGNYFISELIMSAELFESGLALIKEKLAQTANQAVYGTLVIGTVKDDIHDIGKNIAATLLSCRGFKVIDLGVDVPIEAFVEAIKTHKPKLVGISCLLTTCFESIKETIDAIEKEGLRKGLPILIGGATIDQTTTTYVGADAFCRNANEGVLTAIKLAGGDK